MANGCVNVKVTKAEFEDKTTDEKLVCLWDVVCDLQASTKRYMIWKTIAFPFFAMGGGALMELVIHLFKIKPM